MSCFSSGKPNNRRISRSALDFPRTTIFFIGRLNTLSFGRICNPPACVRMDGISLPDLSFGRICNPTAWNIGICNPGSPLMSALQMPIFASGGLQIRQNRKGQAPQMHIPPDPLIQTKEQDLEVLLLALVGAEGFVPAMPPERSEEPPTLLYKPRSKTSKSCSLLLWALRDSNPRPSACKADALNQLS